ncbi:MAG: cation diffusion facilitator family transporter [Planctomycetaceae bacterium]
MTAHTLSHHDSSTQPLFWSLLLATAYMLAEAIGGWWTGSLALWADAGHMLSDSGGLLLSLGAAWMARRPGTPQQTFGLLRVEILAATLNGLLLVAVAVGIAWEAWERWSDPQEIKAGPMAAIAAGGLVVNLLMLRLLHGGHQHNLNVRGAWLHVVGDTLGSVAVMAAAAAIPFGWIWMDPLVSVLISLLVIVSSWRLLREAVGVLMEHSPLSVNVEDVRQALLDQPAVAGVHCLHVWSIASGFHSISAHVVLQPGTVGCQHLELLRGSLQQRFEVEHVTLQLEPAEFTGCEESSCQQKRIADPAHHGCGQDHHH